MEQYKELINNKDFSGIIVMLDSKSNIIDANDEFLSLLGFDFKDIENKHITELIIPDEKPLFLDIVFNQDVSIPVTIKFYHKSGAFRFFSFSILNFGKFKLLFGNTLKKDFLAKKYEYISNKKTDIDKLFENIDVDNITRLFSFENNLLSLLLNLMPIEVWIKDRIGKYVFINEAYSLATGLKNDNCIKKDDFQLFTNETARAFVESDDLVKTTGKKITFSFENTDKNYATYAEVTKIPIYNKAGKYIGMIAFSVNTSHLKATEVMLQKEKSKLLFVLENFEGMVLEVSSNKELLFASGKLIKVLGLEMDNKKLMELFLRSSKALEGREKLRLALSGEKVLVEANITGKLVSFSLNPVKNDDGSYNVLCFGYLVSARSGNNDKKV